VINPGSLRGFAYFGFIEALNESFRTRVDLLTYRSIEASLIRGALRDEVVIYEE
jgi:predicted nucleotidyltransferase